MRWFVFILFAHGLLHLPGLLKAFGWADFRNLTQPVSKPLGVLWLLAAVGFGASAVLILFGNEVWWVAGAPAVMLSQTLVFILWDDAKFGSLVNLVILLPLMISVADSLPESHRNIYRQHVRIGLNLFSTPPIVTDADLEPLPAPVRRYLRYTGTVGKPRIVNFRARFTGQFKRSPESGWMDFSSQQYNFYDDPTRLFFIGSNLFGIPFDALHLYIGRNATMQIKVASLFQVVDAKGDTMTRSETVTLFNDMCIMAPATLIDTNIAWEPVDSLTARATFTNKGFTISALLSFNERGELVDFSSDDRFMSADGITYKNYRWTTPMKNYADFDGRKVATEAEVIWHMPGGDYTYGRFLLQDIQYNCTTFR